MAAMSTAITRQIVLDTETTGMNQIGAHYEGHKIIEIGAVEVVNRRLTGNNFHIYLKPDRLVDPEAFGVHGIADEFLLDKPTFGDIADEFIDYIRGAELVIHNASFDIGFMDYEFSKLNRGIPKTETFCKVTDSWRWRVRCSLASATALMRSARVTKSTTVNVRCTGRYSTPKSLLMSI